MEDLIHNARTLFDERPSQSPHVSSYNVAETTSTHTYSSLFLNPESADVQAMGSTSRHRPEIIDGAPMFTQSSFSSFPSDASPESQFTPPPIDLLSPPLGLSSSKDLKERVETITQELPIPEAAGTAAIKTLPSSTPPDVIPLPTATTVAEWQLHQSRLPSPTTALRRPQSPLASESTSDYPYPSATSSQTGMGSS